MRRRSRQLHAWHAEQERLHVQAVLDERVALARELHDGVANTITTVLVQAAAGRAAARGDAELLHGIERTARQAMEEIQATLRLMPRNAGVPRAPPCTICQPVRPGSGGRARRGAHLGGHAAHP